MARPRGSKNKATIVGEAERNTAAKKAKIFGTDLPEVKLSLDSLDVMEEAMRHFFLKAMIEKSAGEHADWKAVDAAMLQAVAMAKEVAPYRHQRLAALRLAGEPKSNPTEGTLDELLERIRGELAKLGPIIELEVAPEPQGREQSAA